MGRGALRPLPTDMRECGTSPVSNPAPGPSPKLQGGEIANCGSGCPATAATAANRHAGMRDKPCVQPRPLPEASRRGAFARWVGVPCDRCQQTCGNAGQALCPTPPPAPPQSFREGRLQTVGRGALRPPPTDMRECGTSPLLFACYSISIQGGTRNSPVAKRSGSSWKRSPSQI